MVSDYVLLYFVLKTVTLENIYMIVCSLYNLVGYYNNFIKEKNKLEKL